MNSETLLTLCQAVVVIGIVLTAVGGFGAYHFSQRAQGEKEAGVAQTRCQVLVAIGVVLTAAGGFGAYHFGQKAQEEKEARAAAAGCIKTKEIAADKNLAIGGIRIVLTTSNDVVVCDGEDAVLRLKMENQRLYVNTTVRNASGEVIAEMKNNEWLVNKNNCLDRNFSDNALEVRDVQGRIVLQVAHFGRTIHFAGIFHTKNGHVVCFAPLPDLAAAIEIKRSVDALSLTIPPIFEYPSELHFGEAPGISRVQDLVERGHSHFYIGGPINIGVYGRGSGGIVKLM